MTSDDRSRRLNAAAEMIDLLNSCGCPQQLIAAYLGISHAKLSRWKRTEEDSSRKSGVPSREQLVKLVALFQHEFLAVFEEATMCCDSLEFEPAGEHLWYALEHFGNQVSSRLAKMKDRRDKKVARIREFAASLESGYATRILQPEAADRITTDEGIVSGPMQKAHAMAKAAAAAELEASRVTSEDTKRAEQALEDWCKARRDKLRERRLPTQRRQSSEMTDEGSD